MQTNEIPDFLTAAQVAEKLQVAETTVLNWARRGVIPSIAPTQRTRRFRLESVVKALAALEGKK